MSKKTVSIVVPSFNEELNVIELASQVKSLFADLNYNYELIFVDDGSSDNTLDAIKKMNEQNDNIHYIEFSRNFGHQYALKAGIDYASGECVVSMDADLQHPVKLIATFLEKWEEGYDIVYSRRKADPKLSLFKRVSSKLFYKLINSLSSVKLEDGVADFRLMDRVAVNAFLELREDSLFIRGIISWLGFKQLGIDYEPDERLHGTTKYSVKKMIGLALNGITSFSIKPLYRVIYLGVFFAILSVLFIPYVIYSYYVGAAVSGWASVIATIVFFGGIQLIVLGIIGIYLGKLFMQNKRRPTYIVRDSDIKKN